jgi:AraC-like DNA-binding protein
VASALTAPVDRTDLVTQDMNLIADLIRNLYVRHSGTFRRTDSARVDARLHSVTASGLTAGLVHYGGFEYTAEVDPVGLPSVVAVTEGSGAVTAAREQLRYVPGDVFMAPADLPSAATLNSFPNSAMTIPYLPGPGWVQPASVRLAAEFIEAHAGQPVTTGQIAATAGVTSRALHHAFRRYFGTTPAGYLQRVRLEHARQELASADSASGLTVAGVARRWGWTSQRAFSVAYRQRFGVAPSHTLRT